MKVFFSDRLARAEDNAAAVAVEPGYEREDGGIREAGGAHRTGIVTQARRFRRNSPPEWKERPGPEKEGKFEARLGAKPVSSAVGGNALKFF
jgi:hypothetical protein